MAGRTDRGRSLSGRTIDLRGHALLPRHVLTIIKPADERMGLCSCQQWAVKSEDSDDIARWHKVHAERFEAADTQPMLF